jgi:quercetin dioxygenase-like cupin family protein
MKLFRFDAETGKTIDRYGSINAVISRVTRAAGSAQIGCIHLGENGLVGYHQAVIPQLFLVVQGAGWVTGGDRVKIPIKAGQAAFWTAGEWHESGTEKGMTAIVIEAEQLEPAAAEIM